jgi:integrase
VSIRTFNKDHLKEHTGVKLAAPVSVDAPESNDPLVFWTKHEKEPWMVNLHPFATGQEKSKNKQGGGNKFIPFTGRPELIRQLTPAIEESFSYAAKSSVFSCMNGLRDWWRLLDEIEAAAATAGQPMLRVEDVGLLTQMHSEYAHRSGMTRQTFGNFRGLVDTTRMALGVRQTYWELPEIKHTQKHIPPKEQRNALRFAVRRTCRNVLQRWEDSDRLSQSNTEPDDPQEAHLWRRVRYMRNIQGQTGKVLPTPDDLHDDIAPWALNTKGTFKLSLRESVFPNHWDADAVWHQCVLNTGWNPSTLTSLDVNKKILINHFKDNANDPHRRFVLSAETYELVGEKERAGGKEQFVTGQWKSLDGPGHLIKTYLERVAPLRELLKQQLDQEKLKYEEMKDADFEVRTTQFAQVKTLEQGVRSVWLYVDRNGKVSWLHDKSRKSGIINGKPATHLDEVVHLLNMQRAATNARRAENKEALLVAVPHVSAKDFRVWFADYVYRSGNGNMLHVKRALNHARLETSSGYTNTIILNQEASDAARRFINILVSELEVGRVDLTILAHLYRYGKVTPDQEETLAQLRKLPKSRMKVACKDAVHPPAHLKATAGEDCDVQRCMLCLEHAVLLPESLDGIAMRAEELRALQGVLPIETWIEDRYEIELKNNLMALRKFDLNQSLAARDKWAQAIAAGEHYVPGLPLASSSDLMELV